MAAQTTSINPTDFAEAIAELPLSAVYSKVSELRNSIAHLHRSNEEMRFFLAESQETEEDKKELEGYVLENEGVVTSMNERLSLLKVEVERRGQTWMEEKKDSTNEASASSEETAAPVSNGTAGLGDQSSNANANANAGQEDGVYL